VFHPPRQNVAESAVRGWRVFYGAFAVSTVVHLTAVVICAWFLIDRPEPWPGTDILTLSSDERVELERDPLDLNRELSLATTAGSSPSTSVALHRPVKLNRVAAPVLAAPVPRDALGGELVSGLADKVDANFSGTGGKGAGAGSGEGNGGGGSAGPGFFGLKADAKSIVFVVDCSGSMNTRHNSEWKTRFKRVKYEMLKSVTGMNAGQRFYIIFFNNKPVRMPARGLLPATPAVKTDALKWMARQSADGGTDPRAALRYALRLQPDMVYFLTDGAFSPRVRRALLSVQQYRVAIHTFVFGNPAGEAAMKQIAVQNRGKYTYIP
jgi:von Willebrand factor type A domain